MNELRRTLRLFDVALFFLVACTNLQWIATAAAAGPSSLPVWVIGALVMFAPIAIAVMHLSQRYPEEGGMYAWSKRAFGPFAGYMLGWTYWCSNLPYFSALLYFMAGNAVFIGGTHARALAASPLYYLSVSLAGFALATAVNVAGLNVGKWLNNAGALARFALAAAVVALGGYAGWRFGLATPITAASIRPSFALKDVIFWSVIAFAWTGAEGIPFMAAETENPRRTIPRGLLLAVPAIAGVFLLGTAGLLAMLPAASISPLYGIMQGIAAVAGRLHAPMLTALCGVLVVISCLGSVGAWLGIAARIPFVAGIDRYLPEAFARVHPKWKSPVVALLAQAGISAIFILLGQGGSSVKGAYDVLVGATVLITMIPFLVLFASAMRLTKNPLVSAASAVGVLTTFASMILAATPAADEPNKPLAVAKVLLLTALTLGAGAAFYAAGRRNQLRVPANVA